MKYKAERKSGDKSGCKPRGYSLTAAVVLLSAALAGCAAAPEGGLKNAAPTGAALGEPMKKAKPSLKRAEAQIYKTGDYSKIGRASWYGAAFQGKKTANGEIFNMHNLTAAHRNMPLPSYARVTNLKNGSSLIVRVNDRGPYAHNRIIDLSQKAAQLLGYHHGGLADVKVDYVGPAPVKADDEAFLRASYSPAGAFEERLKTEIMPETAETAPQQVKDHDKQLPAVADKQPAAGTETRNAAVAANAQPAEPRIPVPTAKYGAQEINAETAISQIEPAEPTPAEAAEKGQNSIIKTAENTGAAYKKPMQTAQISEPVPAAEAEPHPIMQLGFLTDEDKAVQARFLHIKPYQNPFFTEK